MTEQWTNGMEHNMDTTDKQVVYEGLTETNLPHLNYEQDDMIVKCSILYADIVTKEAELNALELEHSRALQQLNEIGEQIDYINDNVAEDC